MVTLDGATKTFSTADFAVFASMLFVSSGIGVFYAWKDRKNKSNTEFLTSNRNLHWFPVAMSLMASFQSSVTILGYPAEMYLRGTQFWFVIFSATLAAVTAAELFLPVYYSLSFTSVNKYLSLRYNSEYVRLASSISFLLSTVPYMGVVLYGPSLAISSVTNLSVNTSILIIGLICTFYTSIGGIKAVVWTDTIQVFLMFGGLIAVMAKGFSLVGGVTEAFRIAEKAGRIQFSNIDFDPYATNNLWNAVFGMGIMWCGNYCTTQTEVQRYCNVATKKKAKLAIYVNLVGVIAIISLACLAGIALYAYYDHCDPLKLELIKKSDQLMPFFVMETLSDYPGVPGLFVSCVFSASLSTLSSGFNALAAVTWDDFLSRTNVSKLSESQTKTLSKIVAASYGLLAIGMAFMVGQIGSVLQAAISLSGALVGPLFGVYLLGILCSFANATGVLIGLFSGEFFALWILVGSMLYPPSGIQMATYTDKCPLNFTATAIPVTSQLLVTEPIPTTEPMGLLKLYHIAFLLVPISGFLISASVGIIASLCTGGLNNVKNVNPKYMSILAFKLWPSSCVPNRKPEEENSGFTSGSQSKEHIYSHENLANNILADEKQEKNLGKTIENGYKNGHCINMEMANHNNRIKTTETENGYFTTF